MKSRRFGMSFSTVVGQRFGLYSKTRSMLSTSKSGPVPSAFMRTTGLSCVILTPNSNMTLGLCSVRIGDDEIGLDQIIDYRRLNHIAALTVRGLHLKILRGRCNDAAQNFREEALRVFGIAFHKWQNHECSQAGIG